MNVCPLHSFLSIFKGHFPRALLSPSVAPQKICGCCAAVIAVHKSQDKLIGKLPSTWSCETFLRCQSCKSCSLFWRGIYPAQLPAYISNAPLQGYRHAHLLLPALLALSEQEKAEPKFSSARASLSEQANSPHRSFLVTLDTWFGII